MERESIRFAHLGGSLFALACVLGGDALAQTMSPYREYEPIVFEAGPMTGFLGGDSTRLALYVFKVGTGFEPIPFQIDKRRKIHVNFNVGPGDPGYLPENCEYGYYRELYDGPTDPPQGPRADFSGTGLHARDEVVFLAKDTFGNTGRAPTSAWVEGSTSTLRYELTILDPRTGAKRYAYLFYWTAEPPASAFDPTDYVSWEPVGGTCSSAPEACSVVRSDTTTGRLSDVSTLDVEFGGNWITMRFAAHPTGASAATPDVLERLRYTAAPDENEDGWTNAGVPRFLGYTDGKIRVIRAVQGAMSGRRTTKYEFIYPTLFVTRVNLRVHDIAFITMGTDHDRGFLDDASPLDKPGFVWARTRFQGTATPKYIDKIDGACGADCNPTGFAFGDWNQTTSELRHGYVQLFREVRAMPVKPDGVRSTSYVDAVSGSNPANWSIGKYGRGWTKLACTEDGTPDNSGGCIDPEGVGEEVYFARLEVSMFPWRTIGSAGSDANIEAQRFDDNRNQPLQVTAMEQWRDVPPGPGPACAPTINASDPQTGAVDLSVSPSAPCGGTIGTRVYRAEGGGEFRFLHDLRNAYAFVDRTTFPGSQYRYKAVSYNVENTETAYSATVSITPSDTIPPPPPSGVTGTPGSRSAILEVSGACTRLAAGINVYSSLVSGGPYTKINATPIPLYAPKVSWTVGGLTPGVPTYFVATMIDFAGNESVHSPEVAVVPAP